MSRNKKISFMVIIIVIVSLLTCCAVFLLVSILNSSMSLNENELNTGDLNQKVAIIEVNGVISSVGSTSLFGSTFPDMASVVIDKLDAAKDNDKVKAVIISVNSPGGEVYASKIIYNKILEVKETGKPVVVLMKDQAASGGYYISAPADWIIASEMTLTGSIGVKFSTMDMTGLYDKVGVKQIEITNSEGEYKVLTDLDDENSEGYKLLQTVVDDFHSNFVNVVVAGRDMAEEDVRLLADGSVYSGNQAFENGLVDQLGEMQQAMDKSAELADLDNPQFVLLEEESNGFGTYGLSLTYFLKPEIAALTEAQSSTGVKAYFILDL